MTAQIDLPMTGVRTRAEFDELPSVPRGWAWELRSGRLELTLMPVTFWHFRIVFMVLETWIRRGFEISGEQYVADSGFARGGTGKNNFVADGVVFRNGYRPAKNSTTHDSADIHAVIEAVSRDSEDHDAIEKLRIDAMLGIPHYWIIRGDAESDDIDGFATMYELVGGEYKLVGSRLVSQLIE
ncbi:Uma2 family endonuclease [Nocardia sp. XZ_19_385]|uniref:Uma2 family endonuclease n=1 Tax=Nocardia sp. XZ_19_385 TaxID=2769488 RepID=UPI00189035BA|nr:Uma2 family endonuclease [Nocardia sp. XZ_19_385]